jgi:hypothetical protein
MLLAGWNRPSSSIRRTDSWVARKRTLSQPRASYPIDTRNPAPPGARFSVPGSLAPCHRGSLYLHDDDTADHRLASAAVLRAQAQLALSHGVADAADRRALTLALADDFAARYQGELAIDALALWVATAGISPAS